MLGLLTNVHTIQLVPMEHVLLTQHHQPARMLAPMETNNAPLTESIKSVETMTLTPALNGQLPTPAQQAKHAVELGFAPILALTNAFQPTRCVCPTPLTRLVA